ncbi:hypothetical protein KUCAC02_018979 [Chaenocephalus aceratus]|uniref:Uncharacterized protein n=1 Tax=Chaenocephalus aceratus TaxID=36190 RepID=A0ACB9WA68_CHAAC|nr:hypothetical protein KUCAC02_018979 [Chaenocephalus aceratus]
MAAKSDGVLKIKKSDVALHPVAETRSTPARCRGSTREPSPTLRVPGTSRTGSRGAAAGEAPARRASAW